MAEKEKTSSADSVRDLFVNAKPGAGEVSSAADGAVAAVLQEALREKGGDASDPVIESAAGIVAAVKKTGAPVWHAARGALVAVIRVTTEANVDPVDAIRRATRTLVEETAAMDGDFGAAAKGAVQGCIQGAEERGLDIDDMAHAAARAAYEAAKGLRPSAAAKVLHAVGGAVDGVPTRIGS